MTTSVPTFDLPGSEPDVWICTPVRAFTLHSHVLKLCSRWFAASMSDVWWKIEYQSPFRYCYLLDYDEDGVSTLLPLAEKDRVDTERCMGKVEVETKDGNPDQRSKAIAETYTTFETMFRSFYRQQIPLMTLDECTALVSLADQYDALHAAHDSILASLFESDGLDEKIKQESLKFLQLGYKLQSTRIFNEAFVHVVGKHCGLLERAWTTPWDPACKTPVSVMRLLESECDRVHKLLLNAMRNLLRLHSQYERLAIDQITDQVIRSDLDKCFGLWGAEGQEGILFREISKCSFNPSRQHMQQLAALGSPSLPRDLPDFVKTIASELSVNNLRSKKDMPYLTCAKPPKSTELPWLK